MSKIIIIEDSSRTANLLTQRFRSEGYHTLAASDGVTGIQLVSREQPDLVLCEVTVPQLNGYGVLSQLQKNLETAVIPIILLSKKSAPEDIRYGMEMGASDYLIKPCTIDAVLKAVAVQLSKKATLKQWCENLIQIQTPSMDLSSRSSLSKSSIFPEQPELELIFSFIETNFHKPITLADVAEVTNYSPAYMTHLVKCKTQRSVYSWIVERRMVEAKKLLLGTRLTVKEIASKVGYSDPSYFARQFKQYHHQSPIAWQKQNLHDSNKEFQPVLQSSLAP